MTSVSDGKTQESVRGLTLANTSTLPTKRVLFHKAIKVQLGLSGNNGPVRGARGAPSHVDAQIAQLQKHVDHALIQRKFA